MVAQADPHMTLLIEDALGEPAEFRNMFNADRLLVERLCDYQRRYCFACALETGTFEGYTTLGLARLFPRVFTIEISEPNFCSAAARLARQPRVKPLLGNSSGVLSQILPELEYPLFAFLDAHWHDYWPLRDELRLLLAIKRPKLIMIHDFQVPGRNFGFDAYRGQACNLDYIGDVLPHDECRYVFNDRTAPGSANRGVLFIEHLLDGPTPAAPRSESHFSVERIA